MGCVTAHRRQTNDDAEHVETAWTEAVTALAVMGIITCLILV
jgi:hypothetical protein